MRNAVKLAFDKTVSKTPKKGDMIVMHGMLGSRLNFRSLSKRQEMSGFLDVWLVDMRNHGASPHSDSMSQADLASDIIQFMDDHDIPEAVLLGHSMGGKAAMKASFSFPERVNGLIICDIGPFNYAEMGFKENPRILKHMQGIDFNKMISKKEIEESFKTVLSFPAQKAIVDFLMTNLVQDGKDKFKWRVNIDVLQRDYTDFSGYVPSSTDRFDKPIKVIYGTKSDFMPLERLHEFSMYFPQYDASRDLKPIQGGHLVHFADPEQFLKYVEEFNRRLFKN